MSISVRKALFILILPLPFLSLMHFFPESVSYMIHQKFNLNAETNIPTWYSSALLLLISLLSLVIYLWDNKKTFPPKFWLIISAVYAYLSMDEAASIHEAIAPYIKWYYVYAPFAAAFFIYVFLHLYRSEDKKLRNMILGGMVLYGFGALVSEVVWYFTRPWPPAVMQIKYLVEENCEMLGAIIVAAGCLHMLNRVWSSNSENEKQSALVKS
jgi:hypothetical protein